MKKQMRKPISILLSLVLVLTLAFCSVLPAFAEGEELIPVYLSAEGRNDGDLYVDFSAVEDGMLIMIKHNKLSDIVQDEGYGNNLSVAFGVYLTEKFAEDWAAAIQAFCDQNTGYTPESDVFDPAEGGWPLYETEDIFYEMLKAKEAEVVAAINEDLGIQLESLDPVIDKDMRARESYGMVYLTKYHPDFIAAADEAAASTLAQLKSDEWFLDTTYGADLVAKNNGEDDYDASYFGKALLETLDEVGSDWQQVVVTEDAASLENGDYYMLRASLVALIQPLVDQRFGDEETITQQDPFTGEITTITKDEFIETVLQQLGSFSVNAKAADTSLLRYKVTMTESNPMTGEDVTYSFQMPLEEGSSAIINTGFLDENVQLYHPEHAFGDWTFVDAANHSRTCSICGAVETAEHTTDVQNAKEATDTEDGYTGDEVCTVCGQTIKQGEVIPATGETTPDTPDTPDDSGDCPYCGKTHKKIWVKIVHLVMWFFLKVVSVFAK